MPGVIERQTRKVGDCVVVDAAHDDDVDLDWRQTRVLRCGRRCDRLEVNIPTRDLANTLPTQGVRTHVHAIETGALECWRELRQSQPVGGKRDVLDLRNLAHHCDESLELRSDRGFAASNANASQT